MDEAIRKTGEKSASPGESTDEEALEAAIREHAGYVYTVASGIIGYGRREDIEECVSDVFVAFWQNRERYDCEKSGVRTYLCAITRHKALDILRRTQNRVTSELDDACCEIPDQLELEDEVLRGLNRDIVLETVNSLAPGDRELYVRRYYYSQSVKEIARAMKMRAKAVENRLYRAKNAIREKLLSLNINL